MKMQNAPKLDQIWSHATVSQVTTVMVGNPVSPTTHARRIMEAAVHLPAAKEKDLVLEHAAVIRATK